MKYSQCKIIKPELYWTGVLFAIILYIYTLSDVQQDDRFHLCLRNEKWLRIFDILTCEEM